MVRHLLTILVGLTIQVTAFAQHNFGLKASGGLSYIAASPGVHYYLFEEKNVKNYVQPSGQIGLFYSKSINVKFTFTAELLYSIIKGKRYSELIDYNPIYSEPTSGIFVPFVIRKSYNWYNISYLSAPVYVGYNINKLNINCGFQSAITLKRSGKEQAISRSATTLLKLNYNYMVRHFDFGARVGINYQFSNKIAAETSYYYGMINIVKNPYFNVNWKIQQIVLGIRYTLAPEINMGKVE